MKKHHQNQESQTNQIGGGHEELMDVDQPSELEMRQVENFQANEKENDCITKEEAIDGNLKKISISSADRTKYDPMSFLKAKEEKLRDILREELKKRLRIKFYLTMQVRLIKSKGDQIETMEPFFHGRCHIVLKLEDIDPATKESMKKMFTSFLEFQREGSNWTVDKVMNVNLHIVQYQPLQGSSYIPLPAKLAIKKVIVNVQNQDQKCFMWSILAALHPIQGQHNNPNRVGNYTSYQDELDLTNIPFPVRVADVPKFEKKNDISVNVFGYERQEIYPIHLTKERGLRHVNLLVITSGQKTHYCWIKNFNRLLSDQNSHRNQYHY